MLFFCVLQKQFPDVFVVSSYWSAQLSNKGPEGVARWKETPILKQSLKDSQKRLILMPVNLSQHWVLCVIIPPQRQWAILDSSGRLSTIESSLFYINMILWLYNATEKQEWKFIFPISEKENNRHQVFAEDVHNCGVYCCFYAQELCVGESIGAIAMSKPSQEEVEKYRDLILETLCKSFPLNLN